MHPQILDARAYPLFVALAVVIGVAASFTTARRHGIGTGRWLCFQTLLASFALLGARLYYLWERRELETLHLQNFFRLEGFRYPGGLLGACAALATARSLLRVRPTTAADTIAPAAALAMAVVRIGCFLQGCCYGTMTDLPTGMEFPAFSPAWDAHLERGWITLRDTVSLSVHPLQLYLGLWSAAVAAALFAALKTPSYPGRIFLLYLLLHEGGKALFETLRFPYRFGLQAASLTAAVVAGLILLTRRSATQHDAAPPDARGKG